MDLVSYLVPLGFFALLCLYLVRRWRKVGPNHALIISGNPLHRRAGRGFRICHGAGTFIWPLFERVDVLSLEIMTLDITTPEVYTKPGVPIVVDGVAQVKIKGDESAIRTAGEQFLSKTVEEIKEIALQTVEGHLRAIIGTLSVEDIYRNRDQFAASVQEVAVADMANMGLEIVSFTLKDIRDSHGYLEALGKPRTAEVKRDAIIAQAEADRDAQIRSAEARQGGEIARLAAETKIAEADRDFQSNKANYDASVNTRRAEADLAYDIQRNRTAQDLKREEVQIAVVEKEQQIAVQEREIQRRERELEATVKRQADAERYRVETEAAAAKARAELEAGGNAAANRQRGQAEADVIRMRGESEAEVIRITGTSEAEVVALKGKAEAEAMAKKAASFREYNEAAVLDILVRALPEIAHEFAQPLAKTDSITMVSTGNEGPGASKLTGDMARMMAELPAVVESLSGIDLRTLADAVPAIREARKKEAAAAEADSSEEDGARDNAPTPPPESEE